MPSSHLKRGVIATVIALLLGPQAAAGQASAAAPEWPEVTREARPWTRWWWHGSAVNEKDLTALLQQYAEVGLGGVEITPIYGVAGHEARFLEFLSPGFMDRLVYTLREAERIGLGVDIATGTGWPFGGPWVGADDAPKYVAHRTYRLRGGERLGDPVAFLQEPLLRAVGNQIYETYGIYRAEGEATLGTRQQPPERPGGRRIQIGELIEPVEANPNLQALALDQVRFPKPLPLQALMAYSAGGEVLDLTPRVRPDGRLDWSAPAGDWTLYAVFQGWHGKMVERAAPGGEGSVIDHFARGALQRYLGRFDAAFAGRDLTSLRAFFNDSYEVDDAAGQADWTPEFFAEFERRRGYDLRRHLPALFGHDTEERNARVLSDYRETVSDLILDEFTREWRNWAQAKGKRVRNQAHGSPANILDLYAASDIPETEGNEILRFKFASSAANVTGKPLVSAESATWLGEHFTSSLADVRQALDRFLLGGVNHVFYHGTAYSPPDEPWPGWLFYAAVHFTPANPWWRDFAALNRYVARVQSFLQAGRPDNDVLLYFPAYDRYARRGNELLEHFDGIPRTEQSAFRAGAETLLARGYAFDYISDRQLRDVQFADGALRTGGSAYRTVVLPQARFVPIETLEKLADLARSGGTVIVFRDGPGSVPGLADLEARLERFRRLVGGLNFSEVGSGVSEARLGQGVVLLGNDLDALLARARARRESAVDTGLHFVRRTDADGTTYFLVNHGEAPVDDWVPLAVGAGSVALYDPMSGRSGFARSRPAGDRRTEVYLQLLPGESRIVRAHADAREGRGWEYLRAAGEPVALGGSWSIRFEEGGPELPPVVETRELGSWTELPGDATRSFSGTARYSLSFRRPRGPRGARWVLDLGRVHESARVRLNGEDLGTLIGPSYRLEVDGARLRDRNLLEVEVTNLMANRIADLDRRGVFWKKFYNINFPARLAENRGENGLFDASRWPPRPSGLLGPVTLTPAVVFQP